MNVSMPSNGQHSFLRRKEKMESLELIGVNAL